MAARAKVLRERKSHSDLSSNSAAQIPLLVPMLTLQRLLCLMNAKCPWVLQLTAAKYGMCPQSVGSLAAMIRPLADSANMKFRYGRAAPCPLQLCLHGQCP